MKGYVQRELPFDAAESETLCMRGNSLRENREIPRASSKEERLEKACCRASNMYARGKSDGLVVPAKQANKAGTPVAESAEERGPPKGNVACYLLAPDTEPEHAWHRGERQRLVESNLDR